MALLQLFPTFEANLAGLDAGKVIPRARAPVTVGFRSGADLGSVVDSVRAARYVALDAAPAAGKTVVFPGELANRTSTLVVHVLPYEPLAIATHRYVVKANPGKVIKLLSSVKEPWPEEGWVVVSAGLLVARWMAAGSTDMPDCYLLQDESHESGAASAALRAFGPVARGVRSYVAMSATFGPDGARRMESSGKVDEQEYEPDSFEDPWSVEEPGAPWGVDGLDGHVLLFEDDKQRAMDLVQAYNYNGVCAYRLHSGMAARDFLTVLSVLEDKTNPRMCALVADSTFRSGYTFPVSVVVDSGVVKRVVTGVEGRPVIASRPIYEFERVQSRSRGGRLAGLVTRYWRPVATTEKMMCDLGQTDVEAFALICRCLGYKPPTVVSGAVMASGKVPRDVCAALRGQLPLACLVDSQLVEPDDLIRQQSSPSPIFEDAQPVSVPNPRVSVDRSTDSLGSPMADAVDTLKAMLVDDVAEAPGLELNSYCVVNGVYTIDTVSTNFPDGAVSVRRVMAADRSKTVHHGWSPYVRSVAVNAIAHAYNVDLIQMRSLAAVLARVRAGSAVISRSALRQWATQCAERMTGLASSVESGASLLLILSDGFCGIKSSLSLFREEEGQLTEAWYADFQSLPSDNNLNISASETNRVRAWVGETVGHSVAYRNDSKHSLVSGRSERVKEVPPILRYITGYPRSTVKLRRDSRSSGSGSTGPGGYK